LKPSELASIPHVFQQPDGTSVSSPKASTVYSSERVFAAEDRLPAAAENHTAPTVLLAWIEQAARTENYHHASPPLSTRAGRSGCSCVNATTLRSSRMCAGSETSGKNTPP